MSTTNDREDLAVSLIWETAREIAKRLGTDLKTRPTRQGELLTLSALTASVFAMVASQAWGARESFAIARSSLSTIGFMMDIVKTEPKSEPEGLEKLVSFAKWKKFEGEKSESMRRAIAIPDRSHVGDGMRQKYMKLEYEEFGHLFLDYALANPGPSDPMAVTVALDELLYEKLGYKGTPTGWVSGSLWKTFLTALSSV